jgi:hypothetical protein
MIIAFAVVSFFIPIAGWVVFGFMRTSQERAAIASGAFGTLGFLLALMIAVVVSQTSSS